ncbi:MAG: hypothetical protein CMM60_07745 [Rhodospirillaceae bacterium]|jgi:hypothetical protein|nr:hypothetical protein [Rhodospirillaceae bacterium]|tara:strand:+ start:2407 stop:2781 length:375 start_codon:yes stop_codon:yes gene_type:complete
MFGLFGDRSKDEIRRLNRDAGDIIEYARQSFRTETVRDAALITAEHLARAHEIFEPEVIGLKRGIDEYKRLHAEARRKRDDAALTAFTLVQIYLRAEVQGEACRAARDTIDRFMADWAHAQKDE